MANCRINSLKPPCGYNVEGIDLVMLLDFDDFQGFTFEDDGLYSGCKVTGLAAVSTPVQLVPRVTYAGQYVNRDNGGFLLNAGWRTLEYRIGLGPYHASGTINNTSTALAAYYTANGVYLGAEYIGTGVQDIKTNVPLNPPTGAVTARITSRNVDPNQIVARLNDPFVTVDSPDLVARYTSTVNNGLYAHQLETFVLDLNAELLASLHLATKRRQLVVFRTRGGRYFTFGYEGGARITYSVQTADNLGAQLTASASSIYPLFEVDGGAFTARAPFEFIPDLENFTICENG